MINKADQGTKADQRTNKTTENRNFVEAGKFSAGSAYSFSQNRGKSSSVRQ